MQHRVRVRRVPAPAGPTRAVETDQVAPRRDDAAAPASTLRVGAVDDPAERAADRAAEAVLRQFGDSGTIQRSGAGTSAVTLANGGPVTRGIESRIRSAGSGRPLDSDVRRRAEPVLGRTLDDVRIHTGRAADQVSRQLDARAFTLGSDIYFRSGEYQPASSAGRQVLAHELGHVVHETVGVRRLTIRRFTDIARGKEGDVASGSEQAAIDNLVWMADAFQKVQLTAAGGDAATSFGADAAFSGTTGAIGLGSGIRDMVGSGMKAKEAHENLHKDDSISRNLGATQVEESATGFLGGSTGLAYTAANSFGSEVPGLDVAYNIQDAVVKGKGAIEDATAAAKLSKQKSKTKHLQDQMLPIGVRVARFKEFVAEMQVREHYDWMIGGKVKTRGHVKRSDLDRVFRVIEQYQEHDRLDVHDDVSIEKFLRWTAKNGIKEFGYGTEHRAQYERERTEDGAKQRTHYVDARRLGKVAAFGHRRKAETATVQSIEAAGATLDAVGTFTAGGDMGATKATGKALKSGAASYKGVKGLVKRGRRVGKLRTAKNELAYGDKSDRGFGWSTKQFFAGNVPASQSKVLAEIEAIDGTTGVYGATANTKKVDSTKVAVYRHEAIRLLTSQLDRRCADIFICLGSENSQIVHRAKAILHVIAETNLAGALSKIDDDDLDELAGLLKRERHAGKTVTSKSKSKGKGASTSKYTPLTQTERERMEQMKSAIQGIFGKQLAGVGG